MAKLAAFLRGVNVGGQKVPMEALRAALESLGFRDVRTHLNSGNAVFTPVDPDPERSAKAVEAVIAERIGKVVRVLIRDAGELAEVVERNPLRDVASNPSRHLVAFLSEVPDPRAVGALDPEEFLPDRFSVVGRETYLWYPDGVSQGRLTNAVLERRLHVTATSRNWNTVTRMLELTSN